VPKGSHCPFVGVLETQEALVRSALVGLMALGQEVERSLRSPGVFFRWLVAQPLDSQHGGFHCVSALRSDRPTRANRVLDASVSSDRRAQDRSKAKPDEVVQTRVARLSGRAASRATIAQAVRAAEIVLTHRVIWKFAD